MKAHGLLKNSILMIFTVGIVISVLYGISSYSHREELKIKEAGTFVFGRIEVYASDLNCHFTINGKRLVKRGSKPNPLIKSGEYFKVFFNENYPGNTT